MPPRRRPAQISAAALPASRLPLGTPTFASFKSSPSARTTNHSPPRLKLRISTSSFKEEDLPDTTRSSTDSVESLDMAPKHASETPLTKSIAEAKLERQRKRNEEAEVPLPFDKRKQSSRAKGKQWKPFDFTAETSKDTPTQDGGVPVNEVRVNTFRALSRNPSSVRSASLISQRTSETGPSDMERQDSALTENGFQVFTGRKNRKNFEELNAYEGRAEERQATVEAAFDKREIYDVFGNALPGHEYIVETIGHRNGQVQFIQHPNGDVSAQQWSSERYMWENIGQFSNIRKKIEGQLASDRLKGETAYQTLQQNTLSYFKTVAKQREASSMGIPFGPKEIQANMPQQPRMELAAAPTGLREPTKDVSRIQPSSTLFETEANTADVLPTKKVTSILKPAGQPFLPQSLRPRQDSHIAVPGASHESFLSKHEDPFYSGSTFQQIYGSNSYMNQYHNCNARPIGQSSSFMASAPRHQGLNYNFHFPHASTGDGRAPFASTHPLVGDHANISGRSEIPWQHGDGRPILGSLTSQTYQPSTLELNKQPSLSNTSAMYGTPATEIAAPQPKPAVSFGNRTSMSDQLWKITETAKERNLSQSNISRTVLYDPYQNQTHTAKVELQNDREKQDGPPSGPAFQNSIFGKKLQPPTSFNPTSAKFFPTVLAPPTTSQEEQRLSSPTDDALENNLHESSPDTQWTKKPCNHTTASVSITVDTKATPQDFSGPFFTAVESSHGSDAKTPSSAGTKTYDEELNDWWTSGNKFARQQEFFESIMASHRGSIANAVNSPPAHLTPIGPPSRTSNKQDSSPFNPTTTRLLIPVLENLASYVQGPPEKRRDYFCQWSKAPEWCIDRSEGGNNSFFDKDWGRPPARVGRDPRYQNRSWSIEHHTPPAVGRYGSAGVRSGGGFSGNIDRRFGFAGRY